MCVCEQSSLQLRSFAALWDLGILAAEQSINGVFGNC